MRIALAEPPDDALQGPFNSYNRLAQLTTAKDPDGIVASYAPAVTNFTRNFVMSNYHSAWRKCRDYVLVLS